MVWESWRLLPWQLGYRKALIRMDLTKLKDCEYDGDVIAHAYDMENLNAVKLVFRGEKLPAVVSIQGAIEIIQNDKKSKNVTIGKDEITIRNDKDQLYICLDRNFTVLEPNYKNKPAFAIYPIKLVQFFDRLSQKCDLIEVYKELYKEKYGKDFK